MACLAYIYSLALKAIVPRTDLGLNSMLMLEMRFS